jgi:hypothetical protein
MMVSAISALAFAVALLIIPSARGRAFALELQPAGRLLARCWGVELLGTSLLCWFLRDLATARERRGLLLALLSADLVGIAVLLQAQISGLLNNLGWVTLVFYLGLLAAYALVWVRERPIQRS